MFSFCLLLSDPVCIEEIDIVFVLDSSGSVGESNYTTMLRFAAEVAGGFKFGSEGAQFGSITYATSASLDIQLGQFSNPAAFKNALMQISYKATKTNTAQALMLARQELSANGRDGVPKAVIIITDGQSDEPIATQQEAALIRSQGVRILSIGIGPKIDLNELNGISSDPDEDHVFLINDFSLDSFTSILAPLVRETCGKLLLLLLLDIYIIYSIYQVSIHLSISCIYLCVIHFCRSYKISIYPFHHHLNFCIQVVSPTFSVHQCVTSLLSVYKHIPFLTILLSINVPFTRGFGWLL